MPLTSIVTVVLRLYAIVWFLSGLISLASGARDSFRSWSSLGFSSYVIPISYLVVAFLIFMWSHVLARMVTPKSNSEVATGGLTLFDLYCFAFTITGLYFVLSSFADALNWIHYAVMVEREPGVPEQQMGPGFYELTRHLVTIAGGGACLVFAPRFARKLTSFQNKQDAANKQPSVQ